MPEPTMNWEALYKEASAAMHKAYHELLNIATHLDDRKEVQKRVWRVADYLMRHK
ncbi:hypothetical protein C8P63_108110 [Melghirimyces profundicolus]|uniref:Uncharacterized protein n=1 Tax=Melghirimyces profundicolus TaxID=1242148 RepID=A0A2T6BXJ8_9BACL|nr:hypothetical protein [Melghirimyces profundicolus]PTX60800.1 hypothetical protein C8P63_108110 [Melghirimyces profundicolus]